MVGVVTVIAAVISLSSKVVFTAQPATPPAVALPVIAGFFSVAVAPSSVLIVAPCCIRPTIPPAFPFVEVTVAFLMLIADLMSSVVPVFITPITPPAFPAADVSVESYEAVDCTV